MTESTTDLDNPAGGKPHRVSLAIGDAVEGVYTIVGVLGSGGMGTVYLAEDERLGRRVAIKLVHEDMLGREGLREAFEAEARAMAQVRHPNVVTIHTIGEHEGSPFIVMEYVPGRDLATWQREVGVPAWEEAVAILEALCRGVQAIHDAGTLHRDIKPANVLLEDSGRVAISDFGLSRKVEEVADGSAFAFGTPSCVAPEVARQETIARNLATRLDTYALGVLAYGLLTGRPPFGAQSVAGLLQEHAYAEPLRPSTVHADLPKAFDDAVLRALTKSPDARTPSPEAFRTDLITAMRNAEQSEDPLVFLTVDDEATALLGVRDLLLMAFPGSHVISLTDPSTAVQLAVRQRPDIVITDLHMPGGGGLRLCAELRADERTKDTPIVVLTGHGGGPEWRELRALGVNRFLIKPIDFDTLEATVRSLTRRKPREGR